MAGRRRSAAGSRLAFPGAGDDEDAEASASPTRRFTLLETTNGFPDDSRDADEHTEELRLRDLRGRVKAARAAVATAPGLAETLANDWQRTARFYARFGVSEQLLRSGGASGSKGAA